MGRGPRMGRGWAQRRRPRRRSRGLAARRAVQIGTRRAAAAVAAAAAATTTTRTRTRATRGGPCSRTRVCSIRGNPPPPPCPRCPQRRMRNPMAQAARSRGRQHLCGRDGRFSQPPQDAPRRARIASGQGGAGVSHACCRRDALLHAGGRVRCAAALAARRRGSSPRHPRTPRGLHPPRPGCLAAIHPTDATCSSALHTRASRISALPPPPSPPRTKWTRRVPHPVLIGHTRALQISLQKPACRSPTSARTAPARPREGPRRARSYCSSRRSSR